MSIVAPLSVAVIVTVLSFSGSTASFFATRFSGKSNLFFQPVSICVNLTVLVIAFPASPSVILFETTSAYAALILAASVASLAFSNCDVKIGIAIATKTAIIATTTSSSANVKPFFLL